MTSVIEIHNLHIFLKQSAILELDPQDNNSIEALRNPIQSDPL